MNAKNAASNELHNVHHDNDKGTEQITKGTTENKDEVEGANGDRDERAYKQQQNAKTEENNEKEEEEEGHCAMHVDNGVASDATTVGSIAASGFPCNGDNNNEKLNNVSLKQQHSANVMRQPTSGTFNGMCL